jgi:hypothetical protein
MSDGIAKFKFPTSTEAYEFPDLVLPADDPYADAARLCRVKQDWSSVNPKPDFLVTGLDENICSIVKLSWNSNERRLSRDRDPPPPELLNPAFVSPSKSITCLVAASGTGKTRYLFEKCYAQFGVYITAGSELGSRDLSRCLNLVPGTAPVGREIDAMTLNLVNRSRW